MRFALMTEAQQGLSYVEILALARVAEESGFETETWVWEQNREFEA